MSSINLWEKALNDLEAGRVRSANFINGAWVANTEVKAQILEAFKSGVLKEENGFVDKHNLMPQTFNVERGIRIVPGGTSVRRGSFIAKGVIIMPPSYINVGAYIDEGTMVDSHVLVGSCAQIGKKVHLSTAVQIGGVLEPIGAAPVIIEDEAFIGAGAIIVEGIQVKRRAVIAPGVILSKGIPVYDLVNNRILEKGEPIPENAIVVPGNRPVKTDNTWAHALGITLQCAVIVKYRDEKSEASLVLEDFLR
ncbi:MAG: 2,3,4,5-tetrahydropyridine-2,6-dicarboxylate N-succinyltransferase [Bacteriovorax sp.]